MYSSLFAVCAKWKPLFDLVAILHPNSFLFRRLAERSLVSSSLDFHQERRHLPLTLLSSFDCTFTFVGYGRLHLRHHHQLQGVPSSSVGGRGLLAHILIPLQTFVDS
jgi:hypothetical protein